MIKSKKMSVSLGGSGPEALCSIFCTTHKILIQVEQFADEMAATDNFNLLIGKGRHDNKYHARYVMKSM